METLPKDVLDHNKTLLSYAEPGDTIEFPRGPYSHWAVYVGDEEVIHVGIDRSGEGKKRKKRLCNCSHLFSISGTDYDKAIVKRENFWDVVEGAKAIINHSKDAICRPFPKERIVKNAISDLGKRGYNVLFNNCEHFATFCRYGRKWSEQAMKAFIFLIPVIGWTFSIGLGLWSVIKKIRSRRRY